MIRENVLTCISGISLDTPDKVFSEIVFESLSKLADSLGMSTFIFAYSFQGMLSAPKHHAITNLPDWMAHYTKENLRSQDPIVKYLVDNNVPVLWSELENRSEYSSDGQMDVMRQAASFGLRYGVSMPCRASDCLGVLSFACEEEQTMEQSKDLMLYGPVLSNHLMDQLRLDQKSKLKSEGEGVGILTARELDSLFWAGEGKTAWEIGQILSVSERTVVFHLTNVVKKLNASSRQHAVSKAILMGILKPRF